MMNGGGWRLIGRALFLSVALAFGSAHALYAASYADFRADVRYQEEKRLEKICGLAQVSGGQARLDVRLGKAGDFVLLADMDDRTLRVLSQRLNAYVEIPVSGDPRNWRDLVESASAAIMPQTLGMVSIEEKARETLGCELVQGYRAEKSRSVFELGFMGSFKRVTVVVWENESFAPFPLKMSLLASKDTREGNAWLSDITLERAPKSTFTLPEGSTRYTSIMDLLLYALTAF